jgi:3-(3-hydroxy-phenyl)propionate hydroxylase
MNQGLRDATNLAFKLSSVLLLGSPPSFLSTYQSERRPNVREVIAITKELGKVICERDPSKCAERDERMLKEVEEGRGHLVRQDLLPPIRGGFIFESPGAGTVGPQVFVRGHVRSDEVLGAGFQLLLKDRCVVPQTKLKMGVGILPEMEEEGSILKDWFAKFGAVAGLVRPDGVVFGTVGSVEEVEGLVRAAEKGMGL